MPGLACGPVIEYLRRLGVTTVELMPVHYFVDDRHLVEKGLRNYWGYNSLGFFAPDMRYSSTGRISEFKTMVKTLHTAGIEVILDVVYNHTAEGNQHGTDAVACAASTTLRTTGCWRTTRATTWTTPAPATRSTCAIRSVLQLIMDSPALLGARDACRRLPLRSRVRAGARAARGRTGWARSSTSSPRTRCCPQVKLIAEPWDLGEGGYQVGNFPAGWTGMERSLPRRGARLLEGRRRH